VDAQGHAVERLGHRRWIREDLEQVATRRPEHVEIPGPGRAHHLGSGEPRRARHLEAPEGRQRGGVLRIDGDAARQRGGVRAHLGAALHARVPADRHQTRAVATDVPARQAQVHDAADTVDRIAVLGDPHRPHEHGAGGTRVLVRERLELALRDTGRLEQIAEGLAVEGRHQVLPTGRVGGDERLVDVTPVDEALEQRVGEGDVAARSYGHVEVADPRAEQR
jgi:hypothetical protein